MLMNDTKSIMQLYQALPRATPTTPKPQIIVCSATLHSPAIQTLAKQMCEHPQLVCLTIHYTSLTTFKYYSLFFAVLLLLHSF